MNSIPAIFITDFGTAILEHHSVALLTLSHPPVPIKWKKQQQKNFWILFLFHFTFTIEISHFKFLVVSYVFFLSYKRKKHLSDFKTAIAWFFFKPPTIDTSIHRSFNFLKICCHARSLGQKGCCIEKQLMNNHNKQNTNMV